jgi:hypothetical protein
MIQLVYYNFFYLCVKFYFIGKMIITIQYNTIYFIPLKVPQGTITNIHYMFLNKTILTI